MQSWPGKKGKDSGSHHFLETLLPSFLICQNSCSKSEDFPSTALRLPDRSALFVLLSLVPPLLFASPWPLLGSSPRFRQECIPEPCSPQLPSLCVGLHGRGWEMQVGAECSGSDVAFPGTAAELSSFGFRSREFFTSSGFEAFGNPPRPPRFLAALRQDEGLCSRCQECCSGQDGRQAGRAGGHRGCPTAW